MVRPLKTNLSLTYRIYPRKRDPTHSRKRSPLPSIGSTSLPPPEDSINANQLFFVTLAVVAALALVLVRPQRCPARALDDNHTTKQIKYAVKVLKNIVSSRHATTDHLAIGAQIIRCCINKDHERKVRG